MMVTKRDEHLKTEHPHIATRAEDLHVVVV